MTPNIMLSKMKDHDDQPYVINDKDDLPSVGKDDDDLLSVIKYGD